MSSKKGAKNKSTSGPDHSFSHEEVELLRPKLLAWYDDNHRTLPWRRNQHSTRPSNVDPQEGQVQAASLELDDQTFAYRVWVSEIMLQQTQVATVIPYFTRWIAKWPTVADLARAELEEVNALWAGLGYYRRARYLLDGAKHVVEKLNGTFPPSAKELLSIPGVGPYTSAAVASIAFGDKAAAVDGNVIRVVSRLRAVGGDPTKLANAHQELASQMIDEGRPGCFNQAVMELGATTCRPLNPDCSSCPISSQCKAHAEWEAYVKGGGDVDLEDAPRVTRFPSKKEKKEKREEAFAVCVLEVIVNGPQSQVSGSKQEEDPAAKNEDVKARSKGAGGGGKKRQSTLFEMADKAKLKAAAGGEGKGGGGGERYCLLVRRPDEGLLAGLWEFPCVPLEGGGGGAKPGPKNKKKKKEQEEEEEDEEDEDEEEEGAKGRPSQLQPMASSTRQALINTLLSSLLPGLDLSPSKVVSRRDHGKYVHVFSHINRTNLVEKIVLLVDGGLDELSLAAKSSGPEVRWIKANDMSDASLPTLTTKIWKQAN